MARFIPRFLRQVSTDLSLSLAYTELKLIQNLGQLVWPTRPSRRVVLTLRARLRIVKLALSVALWLMRASLQAENARVEKRWKKLHAKAAILNL